MATYSYSDENVTISGLGALDELEFDDDIGTFDHRTFSFLQSGNDLLIYANNGGTITIEDHFDNTTDRIETLSFDGGSYTLDLSASNVLVGKRVANGPSEYLYNNTSGTSGNDVIFAGVSQDEYNTFISKGETSPSVFAGAGDDSIIANYLQYIFGGDGHDTIYGRAATMFLGDGDDVVHLSSQIISGPTNGIGYGNDTVEGDSGNDTVYGSEVWDRFNGGDGNDTFYGYAGDDQFIGGNGDDIAYGGDGDDELYGYSSSDPDSDGNDILYGGAGKDDIRDGAGNDFIDAGDDDDQIVAGTGDDTVHAGNGDDIINGDAGSAADDGDDIFYLGDGDDEISSLSGSDTIYGGSGNDDIYIRTASGEKNTVYGGSGDDYISFISRTSWGDADLFGGSGNDLYSTGSPHQLGSFGNTLIQDSSGHDALRFDYSYNAGEWHISVDGKDLVFNFYSQNLNRLLSGEVRIENHFIAYLHMEELDFIDMNAESNIIPLIEIVDPASPNYTASSTTTTLYTEFGVTTEMNIVQGSLEDDTIYTGAGDDVVYGGWGDDTIYGEDDNDFLEGHIGNDKLYGGNGDDILHGDGGEDRLYGNDGHDTIYGGDDVDIIQGNAGNDTIYGGAGNDDLRSHDGDDIVHGGDGDDFIYDIAFGTGNDTYYGDAGNDKIFAESGLNTLYGGTGNDDLRGGSNADTINGEADDDIIQGFDGNDILDGGTGEDVLYGGNGGDIIRGGDEFDILYGNDGDDTLYGGDAHDRMTGGAGADTFVFESATAYSDDDTIYDFTTSEGDALDISDLLGAYDPLSDALSDFVQITDNGSSSFLKIDADGGANGFVQIAFLSGVTGITDEDALVSSGNLIV